MKLREFSELVGGTIIGNSETEITGVSGIQDAKSGDITFISSAKFISYLDKCEASCIIVKEQAENAHITQLKVLNPHYAFARALEIFYPQPVVKSGISSNSFVSDAAKLGKDVSVLPFSYLSEGVSIGDASIIYSGVFIGRNTKLGSRCVIYPNVTIRENVQIGDRVTIHAGSVIGADGFGYVFEKGEHYKIPQAGGVIIGDDVEIGSNVSVDRATIGNTIIGNGTKIDNLVQIAHNVKIGEKSLVVSQTGIAGSTEIGDFVILGGQVGVADHTSIASGTMVGSQSGIKGRVSKGIYSGSPAIPHATWLRAQALFAKLPELNKRIRELEEKMRKLEKGEKP